MIALYVGIYRIAVGLHRRSVAQRERSIACLVSMAGSAVTQIGSAIGMTRAADGSGPTPPPPTPADAPAAVDHQRDDDEDDDDDDITPHIASRLPTMLFPATSFALFGRLGTSRRQHEQASSACRQQTATTSNLPTSSTEVRPHRAAKTRLPDRTVVRSERSPSKSVSSAVVACSENSPAADDRPSAAARRRKRDAASTVTARPEDLHDVPYFDDDGDDCRRRPKTPNTDDDDGTKIPEFRIAESTSATALGDQRIVRFEAATDDVVVGRQQEDAAVLPETPCNGGRRFATQSTSSQHSRYTSGLVGHVWRHMVVHREGRHAESRLEKASEPDEKQALLTASCPRHGSQ